MAIIWSQQCSPGESCAVRDTVRFSTWPSCPHCTPCFSRGSSGAAGWEGGAGGAQGWKHRNCWEPGCRTADHTGQGEAGLAGGAAVRRKHFTGLGCVQNVSLNWEPSCHCWQCPQLHPASKRGTKMQRSLEKGTYLPSTANLAVPGSCH